MTMHYDVVVVGGGPSGATAAWDLARAGRRVAFIDRGGRIKPCGGAIPPRLIKDFDIPDDQIVARISTARMISPTQRQVDIPIEGGFVGMVDREHFDEFLRNRAHKAGAHRYTGTYKRIERDGDGTHVIYRDKASGNEMSLRATYVIGADGARSDVGRQEVPGGDKIPYVIAYHEIIKAPAALRDCRATPAPTIPPAATWSTTARSRPTSTAGSSRTGNLGLGRHGHGDRRLRPEEGHGRTARGLGPDRVRDDPQGRRADPAAPARQMGQRARRGAGGRCRRRGRALLGRGHLLRDGGGRVAATAAQAALASGRAKDLRLARKLFMREHKQVFKILRMMQDAYYKSDDRRERFVSLCHDVDVQKLTFEAYMNKSLVKARPLAHLKIGIKNLAHLTGLVPKVYT
jgi:geranylgeranyl diphosphate/geranylgeranyl-bacteriochlorophyllide a reductase